MKNIHVIGTNEPSRLFEILGYNYIFDKLNKYSEEYKKLHGYKNKHIYITHIEEINEAIKKGDWHLKNDKMVTKSHIIDNSCKKIILTTDQELIKDGIQPIDEDFLQWFVKNPSCESVKYIFKYNSPYVYNIEGHIADETTPKTIHIGYELKIPQEKSYNNLNYGGGFTEEDIENSIKPKQETLEQVAEIFYSQESKSSEDYKWQQEKIKEYFKKAYLDGHELCRNVTDNTDQAEEFFEQWFSQYGIKYDL
jgi:hypothetical protein